VHVVFLSEVKWSYMRTRKRFLAERFPADWRILFVEPVNRTAPSHWRPMVDGRVTVATVPVLKPSTTVPLVDWLLARRPVRWLVDALVGVWLRALVRSWSAGRPRVLFLSNVLFARAARRLPRDLMLYDCNDDPLGFRTTAAWVGDYMRETLAAADVVVACSRSLARRLEQRGRAGVAVIGNGVELEHFAAPLDASRVDRRLRDAARPRIGYAGAISNWFDFDLVDAVAAAHPEAAVVLIGPIAADVAERARRLAAARPNVLFLGAVPYVDLPHHVRALDVCMIPFLIGGETDVLNPNKLYEYLAAGRQVVTLDYSEDVEAFAAAVWLARSPGEFVEQVGRALAEPKPAAALEREARAHSWGRRAEAMVELMRTHTGGGDE